MALILEIRDARGVATHHRLGALPITLGRGLSNDIILDDPYLDVRHARIAVGADGRIEIDDLDTVNGLVAGGFRASGPVAVEAGSELRAGRTTLRFRDADEAMPPALVDASSPAARRVSATEAAAAIGGPPVGPIAPAGSGRPLPGRLLGTSRGRVLCVAAMLAAFACNTWLGDTTRSGASSVFSAMLAVATVAGLWAALWAAAGRAATHRFQFLAHAAVVSLAMLGMLAWGTVNEWLVFLYPDADVVWVAYTGVFLVVLAALVTAHLSLATAQPWRRQRRVGLLVSGAMVVLIAVAALVADDAFTDVPKFANQLKPMAARWVPAESVSEFADAARELRTEVDEDAKSAAKP